MSEHDSRLDFASVRVQDFPEEAKPQLLEMIRARVGEETFLQLSATLDSDQIIERWLAAERSMAESPEPSRAARHLRSILFALVGPAIIVAFCLLTSTEIGATLIFVALAVFGLIWAVKTFLDSMSASPEPVKFYRECPKCRTHSGLVYKTVEDPHLYFTNWCKCEGCGHRFTDANWASNVLNARAARK